MPIEYETDIKNARLEVVRKALKGGSLEILSDAGARLAATELDKDGGTVSLASLVFDGFPKFAMAEAKGRAAAGQLKNRAGELVAHGLTAGVPTPEQSFDIALAHADIEAANVVRIDRAEIRHA